MRPASAESLRQSYLSCRDSSGRLALLHELRQNHLFLPITLAEHLLMLDLPLEEHLAIIATAHSGSQLALEDFFTGKLHLWSQDLSVAAIREWCQRTDCLLWFRLIPLCCTPHVPQRIRYTILDLVQHLGGQPLVELFASTEGIEDLSPAFHALLLTRSMQWMVQQPRLLTLARNTLQSASKEAFAHHKALPAAIYYLARFSPDDLDLINSNTQIDPLWRNLVSGVKLQMEYDGDASKIDKVFAKAANPTLDKMQKVWPSILKRSTFTVPALAQSLAYAARVALKNKDQAAPIDWQYFTGISITTLTEAAVAIENDQEFAKALNILGMLLPPPVDNRISASVRARLQKTEDPEKLLSSLPMRVRIAASESPVQADAPQSLYAQVRQDEIKAINNMYHLSVAIEPSTLSWRPYEAQTNEIPDLQEEPRELRERQMFFQTAYGDGKISGEINSSSLWGKLTQSWLEPNTSQLDKLAPLARQAPAVFQLCYINTLGRFANDDAAALKLLDFVRSEHEYEMRSVLQAFRSIGTQRSLQELVSCLTRPNLSSRLQMEVCALLKDTDLSGVQEEIRAAIHDLNLQPNTEDVRWDLHEALKSLLIVAPEQKSADNAAAASIAPVNIEQGDLDQDLIARIPQFAQLSSEVRRALRTALFFHQQVASQKSLNNIDLSPTIDMQYKALELTFRESFEDAVSKVVNRGSLQRKLDVIGYARPIPHAMDEFESFINGLPTIQSIPFFSKFKLRKMLRALCQYQPGRRFTLDGLKAFALFFLCFSRQQCRYGLQGIFPLPMASDQELFQFVKSLHIFQDFRNRAAHEGFQPEARNDIEGIWQSTAEIIACALRIKSQLNVAGDHQATGQQPAKQPTIIKKVV